MQYNSSPQYDAGLGPGGVAMFLFFGASTPPRNVNNACSLYCAFFNRPLRTLRQSYVGSAKKPCFDPETSFSLFTSRFKSLCAIRSAPEGQQPRNEGGAPPRPFNSTPGCNVGLDWAPLIGSADHLQPPRLSRAHAWACGFHIMIGRCGPHERCLQQAAACQCQW